MKRTGLCQSRLTTSGAGLDIYQAAQAIGCGLPCDKVEGHTTDAHQHDSENGTVIWLSPELDMPPTSSDTPQS